MEWHVSVFNAETKKSQLRDGEAPDHETAIVENGRALAREYGGSKETLLSRNDRGTRCRSTISSSPRNNCPTT